MPELGSSFMNHHFKNRTDDFRKKMVAAGGLDELSQQSIIHKNKKASSDFLISAQKVSAMIHQTALKLKKMSALSKKVSLFDDKTVEINELTYIVKKEISYLQSSLEDLEAIYGKSKSTQAQSHNAGVVGCLETDIEKIIKSFSRILEERSSNIQKQNRNRNKFIGNTPAVPNTLKYNVFEESDSSNELILEDMENVQVTQEMGQYAYQEGRLSEVQRIEKTLVELHTIFTRMGEMLMDHDVTIGRIDRDIDDATENLTVGTGEVMEYWQNMSTNRWLYAKIFVVLIAFIIAWLVLFV